MYFRLYAFGVLAVVWLALIVFGLLDHPAGWLL